MSQSVWAQSDQNDREPHAQLLEFDVEQRQARHIAMTYYLDACRLINNRDYDKAFSQLERAWRYDPIPSISRELLHAGFRSGREFETVRYASIIDPSVCDDESILLELAGWLSDSNQTQASADYYLNWLERFGDESAFGLEILVQLELGRLLYVLGEEDRAADIYATLLGSFTSPQGDDDVQVMMTRRLLSDSHQTFIVMGEVFLKAHRWEMAEQAFALSAENAPDSNRQQMNSARLLLAQGNWQDAKSILETCLADDSFRASPATYLLLEQAVIAEGQGGDQSLDDLWLEQLQNYRAQRPDDAIALRQLTRWYVAQSRSVEVRQELEMLWQDDPTIDLGQELLDLYVSLSDVDALIRHLGECQDRLGSVFVVDRENVLFDQQAECPRMLAAWFRDRQSGAWKQLPLVDRYASSLILLRSGAHQEANELFAASLEEMSDDQKRNWTRAWSLEAIGQEQFELAIALLEERSQAFPDRAAETQFLLSGALMMLEQEQAALAAIDRAVEQLPDSLLLEQRRLWILLRMKRWQTVLQKGQALVEQYEDDYSTADRRSQLKSVRQIMFQAHLELGEQEQAFEVLERVLDEFPQDARTLNDLGYSWAESGLWLERSHQMVKKAVQLEPENQSYQDSLGFTYLQLGKNTEAIAEFENLCEEAPTNALYREHLGDAYFANGERDLAAVAWQRAADLWADEGDTDRHAQVLQKLNHLDSES